jgi:hypothetical protein
MIEQILPGYLVFFSSWENDADNPQTLIQTGFTFTDMALALGIIRRFEEVSNSFENSDETLFWGVKEELDEVLQLNGDQNTGDFTESIRETFREGVTYPIDTVAGWLHEILVDTIYGQPGEFYWENAPYFLRKIESVRVAAMLNGMTFPVDLTRVYSRFN